MMKKKVFQKLLAVTLALSMLLWPTDQGPGRADHRVKLSN